MNNSSINYWIENKQGLLKEYEKRKGKYQKVLTLLMNELNSLSEDKEKSFQVKGRIKGFEPFHHKLLIKSQTQVIDNPFDSITDLIGVRITVPFLEDIQGIEHLIRQKYDIFEVDYKHRDLSIQEFGYDSTHFTIEIPPEISSKLGLKEMLFCEVQLRTILQDAWAEVEHELVYKTTIDKVENTIRRKLLALNATLSLADITFQEIRDYQRRRYHELQERHTRLLNKVSTVPEKMGNQYRTQDELPQSNDSDLHPEEIMVDGEMNDLFVAAMNAHISNNLDRALEIYTHLVHISPNHFIYNHRGLVYFSLSQYEKALADFSQAIEMEPKDTRVYTNRGLTYRMLKEYEKALTDFDKSLELNPLWTDTFYGRSLTHYDMGNIKDALEDCDRAISLKPDFKQAVRFKQFLLNHAME